MCCVFHVRFEGTGKQASCLQTMISWEEVVRETPSDIYLVGLGKMAMVPEANLQQSHRLN